MKEIETRRDIEQMVDGFYGCIRKDDLLGPIFEQVIQGNWEPHLEKMYNFWETVLLARVSYKGSPFLPHMKLPVEKEHFARWLRLFDENLQENFSGSKAEEALWRAEKMAEMFYHKISYYRSKPSKPLI